MSRKLIFLAAILFVALAIQADVYALELEISGNGNGSNSEVQVQVEQQTTVNQTNEANVSNQVETEANTGGNQANANNGNQVEIQTGNIETQTAITNELNTSIIEAVCCQQGEMTATINGNGANSQNRVELSVSKQTNVSVHQEVNIHNKISGSANTGRNEANRNNGDVTIQTGNISAKVHVANKANQAQIEVACCGSSDVSIKISGNGVDSKNSVRISLGDSVIIDKHDIANIDNLIVWDANTGENSANDSLGDVAITTGDITLEIGIQNGPINYETVRVGRGGEPQPPYDPGRPESPAPPPTPPSPDGGGNGNNGNGADGNKNGDEEEGEVLGIGGGGILPITGGIGMLLALLANIAMFLMGLYLRLRSGRSPGAAPSKVQA